MTAIEYLESLILASQNSSIGVQTSELQMLKTLMEAEAKKVDLFTKRTAVQS